MSPLFTTDMGSNLFSSDFCCQEPYSFSTTGEHHTTSGLCSTELFELLCFSFFPPPSLSLSLSLSSSLCDSETAYSPEELVAMILNYTRLIAQDYAGIYLLIKEEEIEREEWGCVGEGGRRLNE